MTAVVCNNTNVLVQLSDSVHTVCWQHFAFGNSLYDVSVVLANLFSDSIGNLLSASAPHVFLTLLLSLTRSVNETVRTSLRSFITFLPNARPYPVLMSFNSSE